MSVSNDLLFAYWIIIFTFTTLFNVMRISHDAKHSTHPLPPDCNTVLPAGKEYIETHFINSI